MKAGPGDTGAGFRPAEDGEVYSPSLQAWRTLGKHAMRQTCGISEPQVRTDRVRLRATARTLWEIHLTVLTATAEPSPSLVHWPALTEDWRLTNV